LTGSSRKLRNHRIVPSAFLADIARQDKLHTPSPPPPKPTLSRRTDPPQYLHGPKVEWGGKAPPHRPPSVAYAQGKANAVHPKAQGQTITMTPPNNPTQTAPEAAEAPSRGVRGTFKCKPREFPCELFLAPCCPTWPLDIIPPAHSKVGTGVESAYPPGREKIFV
jgi:hypothetical protein